jgi:enoyl-CoA hydratase/carnithine racemase
VILTNLGSGLTPGAGGLVLLPTRVGRSRTLEIVIGADDFDGNTAAQYGCVLSHPVLVIIVRIVQF